MDIVSHIIISLLPLREKVARAQRVTDEGFPSPTIAHAMVPPLPQGERVEFNGMLTPCF